MRYCYKLSEAGEFQDAVRRGIPATINVYPVTDCIKNGYWPIYIKINGGHDYKKDITEREAKEHIEDFLRRGV